jgi:hypothetical protein
VAIDLEDQNAEQFSEYLGEDLLKEHLVEGAALNLIVVNSVV